MKNLLKIAVRNLLRYKRRTLLTVSLITIGVVFVLVFISVSGSFKTMITGEVTGSILGDFQIHRKGYVASLDNLPLNLNLQPPIFKELEKVLDSDKEVASYSPRVKFGGMFSNFAETTNIRLNGVDPEREFKTLPRLASRISSGSKTIQRGEILIPVLLSRGMKVKIGDSVVIVATNTDGSVNGKTFIVSGILESATGPGGRDGYIHIDDAREVLRMTQAEVSEIAVRVRDFDQLDKVAGRIQGLLAQHKNPQGAPLLEVHSWKELSPFYNIARMIDVMTFFIKLMLIAIVLISIMNVMIMAVYERIREIGTIAAIGTPPGRILSMFVIEGFCLGILGTAVGSILGGIILFILNLSGITFNFAQQKGLVLFVTLRPWDMATICLIVIVISVIASLQPALKASRMEPIEALRHV